MEKKLSLWTVSWPDPTQFILLKEKEKKKEKKKKKEKMRCGKKRYGSTNLSLWTVSFSVFRSSNHVTSRTQI